MLPQLFVAEPLSPSTRERVPMRWLAENFSGIAGSRMVISLSDMRHASV
jgi:hypothetical protein